VPVLSDCTSLVTESVFGTVKASLLYPNFAV